MGAGKNKGLNSNLGLCMCIHEQNRKHQFVMVDPVCTYLRIGIFQNVAGRSMNSIFVWSYINVKKNRFDYLG